MKACRASVVFIDLLSRGGPIQVEQMDSVDRAVAVPGLYSGCDHIVAVTEVAQAIDAVTGARLWLLSFLFLERF